MSNPTARYLRLTLTNADRDPNWRPPVLSPRARHLLEVLSSYADETGQAWPSVDTLAERMGITPANVRRARAELVADGWIAVDVGGRARGDVNVYRFPVRSPLELVADPDNPRATARDSRPQPARQRAGNAVHNPRASARGTRAPARDEESIEEPRSTSTDAVPRGARSPGFGGWTSNRPRGPRGPNRKTAGE